MSRRPPLAPRLPTKGGKWSSQFALPKPKTPEPRTYAPSEAATTAPIIRASGHSTQMMVQIDGGARWLFKRYAHPESAHAEAALTSLYRRVSADTVPECSVVYDPKTRTCVGAAVKLFNNFTDLHDFLRPPASGAEPLDADQYAFLVREHRINLTTFKAKSALDQQIEFLVAIGFAEALVMAYYFEDDDRHKKNFAISFDTVTDRSGRQVKRYKLVSIDFDRSAYAVIYPYVDVRTFAEKPPKDSYPITAHDLENFPDIRDADPWYWVTKYRRIAREHGYSAAENEAFKRLKHHKYFRHRMYQMMLRIMITPDDTYSNDIKRNCGYRDLVGQLQEHFKGRKKNLKRKLVNTRGFQKWWHGLDEDNGLLIQHMIAEVRRQDKLLPDKVSMLLVKQRYWRVCRDVSKAHFDDAIKALHRLINSCVPGSPLEQALIAMQQVHHEKYLTFLAHSPLLLPHVFDFIRQSNNTLAAVLGICGKSLRKDAVAAAPKSVRRVLTDEQELLLTQFYTPLREAVHQLRSARHVQPETMPMTAGYGLDSVQFDARARERDGFSRVAVVVSTAKQRRSALVKQTVRWLSDPKSRRSIETLYSHALRDYRAYLSSGRLGAWLTPSTYGRRPVADVLTAFGLLSATKDDEVVTRLEHLYRVLMHSDWAVDSFNMRFAIALLKNQKRLMSAKTVVEQIEDGGVTAAEIKDISMPALSSDPAAAKELLLEVGRAIRSLKAVSAATVGSGSGVLEAKAHDVRADEEWVLVKMEAKVKAPAPQGGKR